MTDLILALLVAIRAVESSDGMDLRANGNNYQITSVCVHDVNRVYGTRYVWPDDCSDEETAKDIALLYLAYYGHKYAQEFGRLPTRSVLARIWNRGYTGAVRRGEGRAYAAKVEKAMKAKEKAKSKGVKK